jgi:FtsH-binding integral membrane protein
MKKIITWLIIGLILLIIGIIVIQFAGHKHMTKGLVLCVAGFIISASYGLTFLQVRKQFLKKNDSDDMLDH